MNRKLFIGVSGAAITICAVCLGLLAWARIHESRTFSQPFLVKTPAGSNYVAQVTEVTVGKANKGYVLLVTLQLQNPNAFDLTLERKNFILVDAAKEYFWPANIEPLRLPANGRVEREILSFAVLDSSLAGVVALQIGTRHFVMLKNEKPFERPLKSGEFVTFHRREW